MLFSNVSATSTKQWYPNKLCELKVNFFFAKLSPKLQQRQTAGRANNGIETTHNEAVET